MTHIRPTLLFVTLAAMMAVFSGCNESEIRRYEVAKEKARSGEEVTEPTAGGMDAAGSGSGGAAQQPAESAEPQRMLAAIVPREGGTWFFKLMGPPEGVASQREAFGAFMESVRFDGSGPSGLGWDLPAGWHRVQSDSRMRVATLHVPGGEGEGHSGHMELTVVRLGAQAGGLESNVNRWRGQIGLGPADAEAIEDSTERIEVAGTEATLVDITGPGGGSGGMSGAPFAGDGGNSGGDGTPTPPMAQGSDDEAPTPPMAPDSGGGDDGAEPSGSASGGSASEGGSGPLSYEVPEGWESNPGQSAMRVASFRAAEGDRSADVSVIPLRGRAGGTLPNVNRWRRQIGLEPIDEQQLAEDVQGIEVDGHSGKLIDLRPSDEGEGAERILAAIVPLEQKTWFFKMRGPAELVGEQRESFERFVRSVRFDTEDES